MKARDLAASSAGITTLLGDDEVEVTHIAAMGASEAGALVFMKARTSDEVPVDLRLGQGIAIICRPEIATTLVNDGRDAVLVSDNPRASFMRLANAHFPPRRPEPGVHALAFVDPSATVDSTASVGAFCFVGPGCRIGPSCILHPHVTLYEKVTLGTNVVIHGGTVIGADGFGYERRHDGRLEKFPHIGGVVIEDDVEIGSNTSIDRGSLESTVLRRGCKVDNQVHVAHNVEIGEDAVVIAESLIGGSVRLGARSWIAPSAVVMNQVAIGDDATVGLGAVVTKDVAEGEVVMGSPAVPQTEFKALRAALKALVDGS